MNMRNRKKRILIVCGGNTCRSPMAKVILEQMLKASGLERQFEVDSAAYDRPDKEMAHPYARETIKKRYGEDEDLLKNHVPKKLTDEIAEKADFIMVMQERMKGGSLTGHEVVVLGIPDPFNQSQEKYDECSQAIERRFMQIWSEIIAPVLGRDKTEDISSVLSSTGSVSSGTTWVYNEVLTIAKKVDYGRGLHSTTVTNLMLNMYDDMAAIGFIDDTSDKRKLAEISGLSHDIGVGQEPHNVAGFEKLEKDLWKEGLSSDQKSTLALVMYAVYYHRSSIAEGKLKLVKAVPLEDYRTAAEFVSLLRVADGLDFGLAKGTLDVFEKVEMVRTSNGVECRVSPRAGKDNYVTGLLAKSYEKREVFEVTFGKLTFWLPGARGSWVPWRS